MGGKRRRPPPSVQETPPAVPTAEAEPPPSRRPVRYSDEDTPGWKTLTTREVEMVEWASEGKRSEEIATILHLATRTVEKHFENIFDKLGVETRGAAVAIYRRRQELLQAAEMAALRQENEALRAQVTVLRAQLRAR